MTRLRSQSSLPQRQETNQRYKSQQNESPEDNGWDVPSDAEMKLTSPYSNKLVNLAGEILARPLANLPADLVADSGEYGFAGRLGFALGKIGAVTTVVYSWRSTYSYPLRVAATLLRRHARIFDPSATVSRRLKRMQSIIEKLQRFPDMRLTTMQDIGGCRAVVKSIKQVNALKDHYKANIQPDLDNPKERDYIREPKEDGYRSVHLVVQVKPKPKFNAPGRRIEIQLRTRLQHEWATAVETVDLFTSQTLKTGGGDPRWKRFFTLIGSVFAIIEQCPTVPNTPTEIKELMDEVRVLWRELDVLQRLHGWSSVVRDITPNQSALGINAMYLVELDVKARTLGVRAWHQDDLAHAHKAYAEVEETNHENPNRSAVLVSVESLQELRKAYPSYYGDTAAFLEHVMMKLDE